MGKDFPYYCLWRLLAPDALATFDAFQAFPETQRRRHFIRRTKEEMVRLDGRPLYPQRRCDTISYGLSPSEQALYEETTRYISENYNRARVLNRSAARLAMSVFQRRQASSTHALMRSFRAPRRASGRRDRAGARRACRRAGAPAEASRGNPRLLRNADGRRGRRRSRRQRGPRGVRGAGAGRHRRAGPGAASRRARRGGGAPPSGAASWPQAARTPSSRSCAACCATRPSPARSSSSSPSTVTPRSSWCAAWRDSDSRKQVALIHGGLDYREREAQVAHFRRPLGDGGANYLVATDAAGEGINLQFCWLMVNYDVAVEPGAPRTAHGPDPPLRPAARPGGHRQSRCG